MSISLSEIKRIRWHFDIAWLMRLIGGNWRTFAECGVGPLDIAASPSVYDAKLANKVLCLEPNPQLAQAAKARMPLADILEVAVSSNKQASTGLFQLNGGSSFLADSWSPTYSASNLIEVPVKPWAEIDDGKIDAMVLDCEGQEWAVLQDMVSRPKLLSVEVWPSNPYAKEIFEWFDGNGYRPRMSTGPDGETILFEKIP